MEFCFLWFLANYFNNASLVSTNVASATILSSTLSLWTLIIGSLAHVEKFSFTRLVSVAISLVGVLLVALSQTLPGGSNDINDWRGDLLALLGAVFYGCYITLLKKRIGEESRVSMTLFFGFVGVFNAALLWPGFFLLNWLGIEQFQTPQSLTVWIALLLNAIIGTCLSEYLWMLSMLMTTPLIATMGKSL